MRLHQIVSILIISSGLMSITAFSQTTCSAEKIQEIKRLILPDISLNRDFIENLFNSVESGKLNCQIKTQNNDPGFSWGSCGYSYPKATHEIFFSGKNQVWKMTVREERIECKKTSGYWLTEIETKLNSIKAVIPNGKKLIVQVVNQHFPAEDSFKAVIYSYKDNKYDKLISKLAIVDSSDSQKECSETKNTIVQELSLDRLGLDILDRYWVL